MTASLVVIFGLYYRDILSESCTYGKHQLIAHE